MREKHHESKLKRLSHSLVINPIPESVTYNQEGIENPEELKI